MVIEYPGPGTAIAGHFLPGVVPTDRAAVAAAEIAVRA